MAFFGYMPRVGIAGSHCSSILELWIDPENVIECHTGREKQISNTKVYMWNLEKWCRLTYLQNRDRDRKKIWTPKGEEKSGIN